MTEPNKEKEGFVLCPECDEYFNPNDIHIEHGEYMCIFCYRDHGEHNDD